MKFKRFSATALLLVLFLNCPVEGQDAWDKYKPRTLGGIIKQHSDPEIMKGADGSVLFTGDDFPSQVKVTYTGASRKMSEARKRHIAAWLKTFGKNPEIADLFESELLFVEGKEEYWLPVQKQVIPYFAEELKKGEQVILFTIWIGAYKKDGKWDWVFLANEFEKISTPHHNQRESVTAAHSLFD